jgi:glycosyltransferase involved in cell wall biosynthesis
LPPNSPELVAAYQSSLIFALPSFIETQPISALEAAATGLPILLADRPYAHQKTYESAMLVNPKSVKSISSGLRNILASPSEFTVDPASLEIFRRTSVGKLYLDAYKLGQDQK